MKKPRTRKPKTKRPNQKKKAPISKGANKLIPTISNNPERKYIDTLVTSDTRCNSSGSFTLLNGCAQGVTAATRIGDKIKIKSLQIRLRIYQPQSDSSIVRYILFYDVQSNGATPNIYDVIDEFGTGNYGCLSLKNNKYNQRFIVLKDKCIAMNNNNTADIVKEYQEDIYLKLDVPVDYGLGTGATIASVTSGALFMLVCASKVSAASNSHYNLSSRIRFIDN